MIINFQIIILCLNEIKAKKTSKLRVMLDTRLNCKDHVQYAAAMVDRVANA